MSEKALTSTVVEEKMMIIFKTKAKKRKVATTFVRLSRRCYTDVNIHLYYSCVEISILYLTAVSVNAECRNFFLSSVNIK